LSLDTYANVTDFEWVISVLVDLAYVSHVGVGSEIKAMVLDVVGRVKSARTYAVRTLEKVVGDEELRERGRQQTGEDGLLEAAIWVCGEYSG
jgi:AP-3 complex subunit delta-1